MSTNSDLNQNPHAGQPIRLAGGAASRSYCAMLMVHGRGARAEDILSLADRLDQPGFVYFAPQAAENTWYPQRFLAPLDENEPWLSSALAFIGQAFDTILETGIPAERTLLLGFSQGACLTLEFAARNARRYGGVVGLTGALIGPDGMARDYPGSLAGTPIFLGCSDVDFHVPKERVDETAAALRSLGGKITQRLYPGMGHVVNDDELEYVRDMMRAMTASS